MTGEWTGHRENGQLMQIGSIGADQKKAGLWRLCHRNGQLHVKWETAS